MRWVLVFVVGTALFTPSDRVVANGRVFTVAKERTSALWSRLSHRRQAVRSFLQQIGVAIPLCFGLACGSITQTQPPVVPPASLSAEALPPGGVIQPDVYPELQIKTELFSDGKATARGITQDSISNYLAAKEHLPAEFYDGMLVHYAKDGANFVRILKLNADSELEVYWFDGRKGDIVDASSIEAILVGTHSGHDTNYLFSPKIALSCNNDGHEQMLEALPEGAMLFGIADMIFTNDRYLIRTNTMFTPKGVYNSSHEIYLMVEEKHVIPFDHPTPPLSPPQHQRPIRPLQSDIRAALDGGEYWAQVLAVENN